MEAYYIQPNWTEDDLNDIYIQILEDYMNHKLVSMFIPLKKLN